MFTEICNQLRAKLKNRNLHNEIKEIVSNLAQLDAQVARARTVATFSKFCNSTHCLAQVFSFLPQNALTLHC